MHADPIQSKNNSTRTGNRGSIFPFVFMGTACFNPFLAKSVHEVFRITRDHHQVFYLGNTVSNEPLFNAP